MKNNVENLLQVSSAFTSKELALLGLLMQFSDAFSDALRQPFCLLVSVCAHSRHDSRAGEDAIGELYWWSKVCCMFTYIILVQRRGEGSASWVGASHTRLCSVVHLPSGRRGCCVKYMYSCAADLSRSPLGNSCKPFALLEIMMQICTLHRRSRIAVIPKQCTITISCKQVFSASPDTSTLHRVCCVLLLCTAKADIN